MKRKRAWDLHEGMSVAREQICSWTQVLGKYKGGRTMYGGKGGGAASAATTAAGVVVLPNTGGNEFLLVASIVSIVTGGVILLSTLARFAAKQAYKA